MSDPSKTTTSCTYMIVVRMHAKVRLSKVSQPRVAGYIIWSGVVAPIGAVEVLSWK